MAKAWCFQTFDDERDKELRDGKLARIFDGSLAEYADRLLLSTGLHVEEAQLIATGQLDPPPELEPLARALRTGWNTTDSA